MGLDEAEREETIDVIDRDLTPRPSGEDALASPLEIFQDIQFRHPGFPKVGIYRFANPLLASLIRHRLTIEGRANETANKLLTFLRPLFPVTTRGEAQLLLRIRAWPVRKKRRSRKQTRLVGRSGASERIEATFANRDDGRTNGSRKPCGSRSA